MNGLTILDCIRAILSLRHCGWLFVMHNFRQCCNMSEMERFSPQLNIIISSTTKIIFKTHYVISNEKITGSSSIGIIMKYGIQVVSKTLKQTKKDLYIHHVKSMKIKWCYWAIDWWRNHIWEEFSNFKIISIYSYLWIFKSQNYAYFSFHLNIFPHENIHKDQVHTTNFKISQI